ncbi:MAG TPA: hypothetical protein VJU15_08480 [Gemmatimonadales bacterium]|nr:hypothetical protein [Gemmatimonadales bacterium]
MRVFSMVLAATTLVVTVSHSQDRDPKRTLGGHNFVPIELLGDPFTGTYVRNSTGGGKAVGLKLPIPDLEGGILGYAESDVGFLTVGLEYQQNITNWLAFRVGGSGGARLGTSVQALLAEGATATFGYNFGLSVQAVRTERVALSVSADMVPNKIYGISPLDFARSVIENGLDSASSLLNKGSGRRLFIGLRPAWAVKPWLGLQGQFEIGPNRAREEGDSGKVESEETKTQTTFGAGASVNLMMVSRTPLGFHLAYQRKNGLITGDDVSGGADTWNLGIYYTGRRAFVVGLDIVSSSVGQTLVDDDINLIGGRITLRYDFK